ncbi:hypothetical protein SBF1_9530002 [Candidatus Desulfosporosinus infrequens]|uniref:Uncharacterized protein n=1 Tax=Candidatus Desulfosporosinus infrequens TaxID=2043169 RepID=A0A2U3LYV9_9FIRM|nr:hypothetical protein SBF1_9530002 [Candidatus Desulfosporosinus infrequens]
MLIPPKLSRNNPHYNKKDQSVRYNALAIDGQYAYLTCPDKTNTLSTSIQRESAYLARQPTVHIDTMNY